MNDMEQALTIGGVIFTSVMVSQYGLRKYNWHRVLMPLVSVTAVSYFYLGALPARAADVVTYAVGALIGVGFGVVANRATGVERDAASGSVYTRTGAFFMATWLATIAVRIAFIYAVENDDWFRAHLTTFMAGHGIAADAIAPFFVIMALATVLSRVALVGRRVAVLRRQQPAAARTVLGDAPLAATSL